MDHAGPRPPPRVALLEGDDVLREHVLTGGLRQAGFEVRPAASAAELYRHMLHHPPDLLVLGSAVPDEDALSVLRHLRELSDLGIVVLVDPAEPKLRIQALRAGADACLGVPDELGLLAGTLRSLSRRLREGPGRPSLPPPAPAGERWHLEADSWYLVSPRGQVIALSRAERILLRTLAGGAGMAVPHAALIAALAEDVYDFDPHRLGMLVHRLRRKIVQRSGEPSPLLTARGNGYVFVAESAR